MKKGWDDPNSVPQVKHVQMFNAGANAYIRIINRTVDATTTNNSDPGSKFISKFIFSSQTTSPKAGVIKVASKLEAGSN